MDDKIAGILNWRHRKGHNIQYLVSWKSGPPRWKWARDVLAYGLRSVRLVTEYEKVKPAKKAGRPVGSTKKNKVLLKKALA